MCLGQRKTSAKSNQITAIPEIFARIRKIALNLLKKDTSTKSRLVSKRSMDV
jgi:predicted transposase YbfD/YdcC